jgi:hypothetical protein
MRGAWCAVLGNTRESRTRDASKGRSTPYTLDYDNASGEGGASELVAVAALHRLRETANVARVARSLLATFVLRMHQDRAAGARRYRMKRLRAATDQSIRSERLVANATYRVRTMRPHVR